MQNHERRRNHMKILFAPDSFKGSMSSFHAIELLHIVTQKHFPGCQMVDLPIGDGGEGTVESLIHALGGHYAACKVTGPLGEEVEARYGILDDTTAILEMAQASGLPLLQRRTPDILHASSIGTGQLLRHILMEGYTNIYLLLGGSATNDGGLGAATALGIRFLDAEGKDVSPDGAGLAQVVSIDAAAVLPQLQTARITLMCDVKNPLLGPDGATYVYGKQKGAGPEEQARLEAGMENYIRVVEEACGRQFRDVPGCGAAGGLSVPLLAFAHAEIRSGIETVLSLMEFDKLIEDVDLVVTGEGRLDYQSTKGKVLSGIGLHCARQGVPAVAVVGCMGEGAEQIYDCGIVAAISCMGAATSQEDALARADAMFLNAADRMYRLIKLGMSFPR